MAQDTSPFGFTGSQRAKLRGDQYTLGWILAQALSPRGRDLTRWSKLLFELEQNTQCPPKRVQQFIKWMDSDKVSAVLHCAGEIDPAMVMAVLKDCDAVQKQTKDFTYHLHTDSRQLSDVARLRRNRYFLTQLYRSRRIPEADVEKLVQEEILVEGDRPLINDLLIDLNCGPEGYFDKRKLQKKLKEYDINVVGLNPTFASQVESEMDELRAEAGVEAPVIPAPKKKTAAAKSTGKPAKPKTKKKTVKKPKPKSQEKVAEAPPTSSPTTTESDDSVVQVKDGKTVRKPVVQARVVRKGKAPAKPAPAPAVEQKAAPVQASSSDKLTEPRVVEARRYYGWQTLLNLLQLFRAEYGWPYEDLLPCTHTGRALQLAGVSRQAGNCRTLLEKVDLLKQIDGTSVMRGKVQRIPLIANVKPDSEKGQPVAFDDLRTVINLKHSDPSMEEIIKSMRIAMPNEPEVEPPIADTPKESSAPAEESSQIEVAPVAEPELESATPPAPKVPQSRVRSGFVTADLKTIRCHDSLKALLRILQFEHNWTFERYVPISLAEPIFKKYWPRQKALEVATRLDEQDLLIVTEMLIGKSLPILEVRTDVGTQIVGRKKQKFKRLTNMELRRLIERTHQSDGLQGIILTIKRHLWSLDEESAAVEQPVQPEQVEASQTSKPEVQTEEPEEQPQVPIVNAPPKYIDSHNGALLLLDVLNYKFGWPFVNLLSPKSVYDLMAHHWPTCANNPYSQLGRVIKKGVLGRAPVKTVIGKPVTIPIVQLQQAKGDPATPYTVELAFIHLGLIFQNREDFDSAIEILSAALPDAAKREFDRESLRVLTPEQLDYLDSLPDPWESSRHIVDILAAGRKVKEEGAATVSQGILDEAVSFDPAGPDGSLNESIIHSSSEATLREKQSAADESVNADNEPPAEAELDEIEPANTVPDTLEVNVKKSETIPETPATEQPSEEAPEELVEVGNLPLDAAQELPDMIRNYLEEHISEVQRSELAAIVAELPRDEELLELILTFAVVKMGPTLEAAARRAEAEAEAEHRKALEALEESRARLEALRSRRAALASLASKPIDA